MSEFQVKFEWEESPRVQVPELKATWARLEIRIANQAITKVEVARTQSVRSGIYVPLFPLAEWMVANWWFLWEEWRRGYVDRHNLAFAKEGFALPELQIWPTETKVELCWEPVQEPAAGLAFLSSGHLLAGKDTVQAEFRRLVESVIERLESRGLAGSRLAADWEAVLESEMDTEQAAFCRRAARLGCDPFNLDDGVADQLTSLSDLIPDSLADDFCDAVRLADIGAGAQAIQAFVESAGSQAPPRGDWLALRESVAGIRSGVPWQDGYRQAQSLRSRLGVQGPINGDLAALLRAEIGSFELLPLSAPAGISAISLPLETGAPVFGAKPGGREESHRFSWCRALADYLVLGQPSLVTAGGSEHQQRNRAFAAEFLAPAISLRDRIQQDQVGEDDLERLASEFYVSERVIRHQIRNHRLGHLNS